MSQLDVGLGSKARPVRESSPASADGRSPSRAPGPANPTARMTSTARAEGPTGWNSWQRSQRGASDRQSRAHAGGLRRAYGTRHRHGCGHARQSPAPPARRALPLPPPSAPADRERRKAAAARGSNRLPARPRPLAARPRKEPRGSPQAQPRHADNGRSRAVHAVLLLSLPPSGSPTLTAVKRTFRAEL